MNKNLLVYLNQIKLGTFATKDNKIYFEYDKDFLKSSIN